MDEDDPRESDTEETEYRPDPAETLAVHLGPEPTEDVEERVLEALNDLGLELSDSNEQTPAIALSQEHPEQARVEVIRTPPDDNDMIVVVDGQQGETPLRSGSGVQQRQEYRQLFSRLRSS
jgi:hypothetical protein